MLNRIRVVAGKQQYQKSVNLRLHTEGLAAWIQPDELLATELNYHYYVSCFWSEPEAANRGGIRHRLTSISGMD